MSAEEAQRHREAVSLCAAQAEDLGLWFPVGAVGSQLERLQLALRRLHGVVEGEPTPWMDRAVEP